MDLRVFAPAELTSQAKRFLAPFKVNSIVSPIFSGRNLGVFRDVIPPPVILLANREQILDELRRLADRMRR